MPDNDDKTSQLTLSASSISLLRAKLREVLRCPHCRLVQFRTRNDMCRRCHKPLNETEELRVSPDPSPPVVVAVESAIVNQLGIRVLELRRRRGLSQGEFAERMKVPRTYISKIERSRSVPTLKSLCRIASALEVEVHYLLCDDERCEFEAIAQNPFVSEMAHLVEYLNPRQRTVILEAAREVAVRNNSGSGCAS